jgi:hypothetical protein
MPHTKNDSISVSLPMADPRAELLARTYAAILTWRRERLSLIPAKLAPTAFSDQPATPSEITTDDARRVPVFSTAAIPAGAQHLGAK